MIHRRPQILPKAFSLRFLNFCLVKSTYMIYFVFLNLKFVSGLLDPQVKGSSYVFIRPHVLYEKKQIYDEKESFCG